MEPQNQSKKIIGIIIGIIVLIGLAIVVFGSKKSAETPIETVRTPTPETPATVPIDKPKTPPVDKPKQSSSVYKDGTYTATGSYMSPGGPDKVGVMLTLKNDLITAITVTPEPGDNTSARYQNMFVAAYKQYVVGQNIALTSKGFNDALAQIKTQAKA